MKWIDGTAEARLKEFGNLQFQITPAEAQVIYRRGDSEAVHEARSGDTVLVAEGRYIVSAKADGYTGASQTFTVTSGQLLRADLKLTPITAIHVFEVVPQAAPITPGMFEQPTRIDKEGGWWRLNNGFNYAFLRSGIHSFHLTFSNPGRGAFKKKKMEWVVDYVDDKNKVVYEMDDDELTVRPFVGGSEKPAQHAPHQLGRQDSYTVWVTIEPSRVVVRKSNGALLHAYKGQDLTSGKIGLKGATLFTLGR